MRVEFFAFRQQDPVQAFLVCEKQTHPGVELRANLESISRKCNLFEVAFPWELTEETIHLSLGCLQGGRVYGARFRVHGV